MKAVSDSGGKYHILVIVADGQVSYIHMECTKVWGVLGGKELDILEN